VAISNALSLEAARPSSHSCL